MTILAALPGMMRALLVIRRLEETGNSSRIVNFMGHQLRFFGLVARDRDFGGLIFSLGSGPGVIYLRILPSTLNSVHAEFERVLQIYSEQELLGSFLVVEPGRHRIRRPAPGQGP